jgi:lysophospholipase L1-like esterase
MAAMVSRRFGSDPRVLYVNLGDAVDLMDPALSFDRMHLTAEGNRRIAAALVDPVLQLIARRGGQ